MPRKSKNEPSSARRRKEGEEPETLRSPGARSEGDVAGGRKFTWRQKALACLLPFLLLVLLEFVLRLCGSGYNPDFLIATGKGDRVYNENPLFGRRYFPATMARTPQPLRTPVNKPADVCRILVLGESAAMGDPEPDLGFPRRLQVLLNERRSGRRFEVINAAMTAINSHSIVDIARDCQALKADYWIVYMGNNEVVGPYGAGSVFGARALPAPLVRVAQAVKSTRVGQLLNGGLPGGKDKDALKWAGMEMFLRQQCAATDPMLKRTYANFEKNLAAILRLGRQSGATVILCTVGVNLVDCAPFASLHRSGLSAVDLAEWDRLYTEGSRRQSEGKHEAAANLLAAAVRIDDQYAELAFRRGQCATALSQPSEARGYLLAARDLDALRFRADSSINRIIREAGAAADARLWLLDIEKLLADRSPSGLPGRNFFYEHVHLNHAGNDAVARAIAERIDAEAPPPGIGQARPWLTPEQASYQLGLTPWNQVQTARLLEQRLERAPYTHQLGHEDEMRRMRTELAALEAALPPEALRQSRNQLQGISRQATNDWVLARNYARFLHQTGDDDAAIEEWRRVAALVPHNAEARGNLGCLLAERGHLDAAEIELQAALKLNPGLAEAQSGLGLCRLKRNQLPEAIADLQKALRLDPGLVSAHVRLAEVYVAQGRSEEARQELKLALKLQPNQPAAAAALAKLTHSEATLAEGIDFWTRETARSPDNAEAHYKLGNALAAAGRFTDAVASFDKALKLKPDDVPARAALGQTLMRLGRPEQALDHFAEVVKRRPTEASAFFDQGSALAGLQRFAEARTAFGRALELDPNHKEARLNLGVALIRLNELEAAVEQFTEAVRRFPGDPLAAQYLAQAKARQRLSGGSSSR